jgi:hypothetical protein
MFLPHGHNIPNDSWNFYCHIKKILLPHGKYSYNATMIIQHIIYLVT